MFDPRCLPSSRGPSRGSASVPRLGRRGPLPGIRSLVAVARFELAACPPARPRPDLRLGGSCHSPTSAIAKSTSTPASDPSLHRTEPVTARLVAPRELPRDTLASDAANGTEAPPAPKRRRDDREPVESASALRRIGRLTEPRAPRGHRRARPAALETPGCESLRSRPPSCPRPAKGTCIRTAEVPSTARETDGASWAPPLRPSAPRCPLRAPGFPTFTPLFAGRCSSP